MITKVTGKPRAGKIRIARRSDFSLFNYLARMSCCDISTLRGFQGSYRAQAPTTKQYLSYLYIGDCEPPAHERGHCDFG
jgi:hypothetical protein